MIYEPRVLYFSCKHSYIGKQVETIANSLYEMQAGNHGSCIHWNKYLLQDDEYNYHDSLQKLMRTFHVIIKFNRHFSVPISEWSSK